MPRKARDRAAESSPEVGLEEEKFPEKLWRLAKDARVKAVQWAEEGDGILIYQKTFTQELLTKKEFFKTKSFDSVVRNLNLYGFKKVQLDCVPEQSNKRARKPPGDNLLYYKHPFFHRDKPDSLHLVRRPSCSKSAIAERRRCRLVQALTALRANLPDDDRPDLGQLLNTIGGGDAPPTAGPSRKGRTPREKPSESKSATLSSADARAKSTGKKRPRGRLQHSQDATEDYGTVTCMQRMVITATDNPNAAMRNDVELQGNTVDMDVDVEATLRAPEIEAVQTVVTSTDTNGVNSQGLDLNQLNVEIPPFLGESSLPQNDPFGGSYYPLGESDSTWCHGLPPQCYGDDHAMSCRLPNRQWAWQAYGGHVNGYSNAWPAPCHPAAPYGWNNGQAPVPCEIGNPGEEHMGQEAMPSSTMTPLSTVDVRSFVHESPGVASSELSPTVTLTVL